MDEFVDILDADGNFTDKVAMKSEAHKNGWFHSTVHVWFYTLYGKVLLQQRGRNKDTHPLLWDVSVAGHVAAGEALEVSAIREVEEEIGLTIAVEDLYKIGLFKSVHIHHEDLIDCEFHHTFLCQLKVPLENLKKQESEVEDLQLVPLLKFSEETWGMANLKKYVPHGASYYETIVKAVQAMIKTHQ